MASYQSQRELSQDMVDEEELLLITPGTNKLKLQFNCNLSLLLEIDDQP
jgi:hypothetical protein